MRKDRFGRGSYWIAVAILALPLGLIVLTSLTDATIVGFPLRRFSLRWYAAALRNRDNIRAFWFSASLAVLSATLSVMAGTWIALAAEMLRPRWRFALFAGATVPLVTPGIVHAIALRIAIRSIGIAPGPLAVLFGHVVHATPLAAIMIGARLAATPRDLMEAARDLGAGPIAAFAHVRLPWLGPTILAAAVLSGLNSFDDFVRSFFLAGYTPTLPVLIFGRLRSGLTPEINALATLALLAALSIGGVSAWVIGRWRRTPVEVGSPNR